MSQKHPSELRDAVKAFVAEGHSRRAAARQFGVSASFVIKLMANRKAKTKAYEAKNDRTDEVPSGVSLDIVTGERLAELLGVSTRSISEFAVRGIIMRDGRNRFPLKESIQGYCEHIRTIAAGRGGEDAQALSLARARLATEQADSLEMKNARERRELLPRDDVHLTVTEASPGFEPNCWRCHRSWRQSCSAWDRLPKYVT